MVSILALSIDAMLPALDQIGRDLAVAKANDVQLVISAMFLGFAAGQLVAGPLSACYGRKPVIYGGYVIFIADGEFTQGALHTNFRLNKDGESVALFDTDGQGNQVVDIYTYGLQQSDESFGRLWNLTENWGVLPVPSPGSLNVETPLDYRHFLPTIRLQSGC